jgi:tripartite-type tricarboxylate transporter receptor subunit TctC
MKKFFGMILVLTLVTSAVFAAGGQASASYPTKPITCIIPYAPGGGSDTLVRNTMRFIQMPNGQPWAAMNVEGAGGFTGAMRAFNSAPDGYTIFTHNTTDLLSYMQSGQDTLPILTQATAIALVVTDYNVISTNRASAAEFGWNSIEDVVAWIRANPNQRIRYGVTGANNDNWVSSLRVFRELGIEDNINMVSYDSGATVRTASLQNEVQLSMNTASELPGVVASGDNIPLLIINNTRVASLPNVPSTAEKGLNVTMTKARGFYGPRGMDPAHVKILSDALKAVTENPEFRAAMGTLGFDVLFVDGPTATRETLALIDEVQPFFDELRGNR